MSYWWKLRFHYEAKAKLKQDMCDPIRWLTFNTEYMFGYDAQSTTKAPQRTWSERIFLLVFLVFFIIIIIIIH